MDIVNDSIIRKLTISDMDEIVSIIKNVSNFWHVNLSDEENNSYIEKYEQKLLSDNCLCLGAFYNNTLIMESSALFPSRFPFWYVLSLRNKALGDSLYHGIVQRDLFRNVLSKLMFHAEGMGYFSFYSQKSSRHQAIINKQWDRCLPTSPLYRYTYYLEEYYPSGTPSKYIHHDILFKNNDGFYKVDSSVYLYCLKQEFRILALGR